MKMKVLRIEQKGCPLYTGVLPAKVLLYTADVDIWSLSNPKGYQRPLVPARVRLAANYLEGEEGVFPTSVLLSVRGQADFESSGTSDGVQEGYLHLPEERPFQIVDGQHRVAGLARAIEDGNTELEEYQVPVTVLLNPDRYTEMRHFYIVNTRQKGVPADVAERLLLQMREKSGLLSIVEFEPQGQRKAQQAKAVSVVDSLREMDGPWHNMVVVPGEKKPSPAAVRQHTVVISLVESKILSHPTLKELDDKDLAILLNTYWSALRDLLPEAFANPKEHSVQRTAGIYSLHMIFPDVFERCREVRDYSRDKMKEILGHLGMTSVFWSLNQGKGDMRTFGTGMKAIRYLAGYLREQLPPLALVGL
jgi:DGQHR domain-containing protein